jgi:hypothetical protein
MAKTSRKKKNEKKDFQKVKFKVGKKLPTADNVTNVSFKSKGIRIKEQLKTDAAQPSNKRKQNINVSSGERNLWNLELSSGIYGGTSLSRHLCQTCQDTPSKLQSKQAISIESDLC